MENAAYVRAVGQVELVFTFIASYFLFRERSTVREAAGTVLVVVGHAPPRTEAADGRTSR